MIEILTDYPEGILAFSAKGEVTADDYKNILVPAIEKSIKQHNKITALYYLGPEFTGYTAGAMLSDTKIGLAHLMAWEKIAVVSDIGWVRNGVHIFGFIMPCPVKVFSNKQLSQAKTWIQAK